MSGLRRPFLWGLALAPALAVAGLAAWVWLGQPGAWMSAGPGASGQGQSVLEKLEVHGKVPDFSLTERSGRQVAPADLRGKVWIATFFYTECTEACPLQSANLARLQAEFSAERDLRLVSITLDPEHDTPEVLSEYARRFRADPERWLFLTGPKSAIYALAVEGFRLGVTDTSARDRKGPGNVRVWIGPGAVWAHPFPNPERKPLIHSSRFVLVDRQAQIRGYYHGTDPESLARLRENLNVLLSMSARP